MDFESTVPLPSIATSEGETDVNYDLAASEDVQHNIWITVLQRALHVHNMQGPEHFSETTQTDPGTFAWTCNLTLQVPKAAFVAGGSPPDVIAKVPDAGITISSSGHNADKKKAKRDAAMKLLEKLGPFAPTFHNALRDMAKHNKKADMALNEALQRTNMTQQLHDTYEQKLLPNNFSKLELKHPFYISAEKWARDQKEAEGAASKLIILHPRVAGRTKAEAVDDRLWTFIRAQPEVVRVFRGVSGGVGAVTVSPASPIPSPSRPSHPHLPRGGGYTAPPSSSGPPAHGPPTSLPAVHYVGHGVHKHSLAGEGGGGTGGDDDAYVVQELHDPPMDTGRSEASGTPHSGLALPPQLVSALTLHADVLTASPGAMTASCHDMLILCATAAIVKAVALQSSSTYKSAAGLGASLLTFLLRYSCMRSRHMVAGKGDGSGWGPHTAEETAVLEQTLISNKHLQEVLDAVVSRAARLRVVYGGGPRSGRGDATMDTGRKKETKGRAVETEHVPIVPEGAEEVGYGLGPMGNGGLPATRSSKAGAAGRQPAAGFSSLPAGAPVGGNAANGVAAWAAADRSCAARLHALCASDPAFKSAVGILPSLLGPGEVMGQVPPTVVLGKAGSTWKGPALQAAMWLFIGTGMEGTGVASGEAGPMAFPAAARVAMTLLRLA